MPIDQVDDAVEVLLQLPQESALADPRDPGERHEARLAVACGGVEQVLELRQLVVPADERRLEGRGPTFAATLGHDAHGAPQLDRQLLAFQLALPSVLERDRARSSPVGRVADQDRSGRRDRLQARGSVDEVAGDHPLPDQPDRDRGLAGQHAGAGL